jgi:sensor domain CHASE-containing protein
MIQVKLIQLNHFVNNNLLNVTFSKFNFNVYVFRMNINGNIYIL